VGITVPGILLGIGLGGFVDGIVLHQILQWHHMLSSTTRYPATDLTGLQDNTFADGLFHATTWVAATIGVFLLWRAARRGATVWGNGNLLGWALEDPPVSDGASTAPFHERSRMPWLLK
jgi:uncharacterized membrane protein